MNSKITLAKETKILTFLESCHSVQLNNSAIEISSDGCEDS